MGANRPVKQFPVQVSIPSNASPCSVSSEDIDNIGGCKLSGEAAEFRRIYTAFRNVLHMQLDADAPVYMPKRSLSGDTTGLSLEDSTPLNVWQKVCDEYKRLEMPSDLDLSTYVRVLFWLLQCRSYSIPQPGQVLRSNYLELVYYFWKSRESSLSKEFMSFSKKLSTDLVVMTAGYNYSQVESVYKILVDRTNGFTPLFRYTVSRNTIGSVSLSQLRPGDTKYVELIDRQAKKHQILASLEYTLFPLLFDKVWGDIIPKGFADDAWCITRQVINRFVSQ